MFKVDFEFRGKLIEVVSNFGHNKRPNSKKHRWCLELRHMILKSNWQEQIFTTSLDLSKAIEAYAKQHLKTSFLGFKRVSVLKKHLFEVIAKELPEALGREVKERMNVIMESNDANRLIALAEENCSLRKSLNEMTRRAEHSEVVNLMQQEQIQKLRQENERLQIQLAHTLNRIDQLERGLLTLQGRLDHLEQEKPVVFSSFSSSESEEIVVEPNRVFK